MQHDLTCTIDNKSTHLRIDLLLFGPLCLPCGSTSSYVYVYLKQIVAQTEVERAFFSRKSALNNATRSQLSLCGMCVETLPGKIKSNVEYQKIGIYYDVPSSQGSKFTLRERGDKPSSSMKKNLRLSDENNLCP
ncbi:hypothetical protein CHS0354_009706 [Potamilus streckersoni]|uniref:Uncharacterized protein n=1 Tax=Potamilus streckersoni TaxID=2493646 RepID=A0AAE0VN72_9BIVA|nr:hypothetical protein CHS0354_009706 [Potamilus streckersoni]